jgi:hypothetical protein
MNNIYVIIKSDRLRTPVLETPVTGFICVNMAILKCGKLNHKAKEDTYYYIKKIPLIQEEILESNLDYDMNGIFIKDSKGLTYELEEVNSEIQYKNSDVYTLGFSKNFTNALKEIELHFRNLKK